MHTLTADTLTIQQGDSYTPIVQVTIGGNGFLSTDPDSGLILVEVVEEGQSYRATLEIKLSILQIMHPEILRQAVGRKVNIIWGYAGTTQRIKSPPLFVVGVSGVSEPGNVVVRFDCMGWWELLAASRVVRDPTTAEDPPPVWPADTTVKSILTEILVGRGNVFLDDDDGVVNTYRPFYEADGLESVLTTVRNLLDMTSSYIRIRDDGFHIVNPQPSSPLSYTYDLDDHAFFKRSESVMAVVPNRIVMVPSLPTVDEAPDFIGVALDQDSIDRLGYLDSITADEGLKSEGEANARAYYILHRLKAESSAGIAVVPMNIGQELYDRVAMTDDRIGTVPIYSFIGMIKRLWRPGEYSMEIGLGGLMPHLSGLYTALTPSTVPVMPAPYAPTIGPVLGPPLPPIPTPLPVSPWERIAIQPPPTITYPGGPFHPPVPDPIPYAPRPTPPGPTPTYRPPPTATPTPPPAYPDELPVSPWERRYE